MTTLRSLLLRPEPGAPISSSLVSNRPRSACISFKPTAERSARILHATRSSERAERVASLLARDDYELQCVHSPDTLFDAILSLAPDLLLIDDDFQHVSAAAFCAQLQVMAMVSQPRLVFIASGEIEEGVAASTLLAGADDYVRLDRGAEVQARVRVALRRSGQSLTLARVTRERNELHGLAFLDSLTGVPNRRSLNALLDAQAHGGQGFAVMFIDIDFFKSINDLFGHASGDNVLRRVAGALQAGLRSGDYLCRYGGEEFLVVAPGATREAAHAIAEGHRLRVAQLASDVGGDLPLTVSIGVDVIAAGDSNVERALKNADAALYDAKRSGRNRTVIAGAPEP